MIPNYLNHRGGGFDLRREPVYRKGDRVRYQFGACYFVGTVSLDYVRPFASHVRVLADGHREPSSWVYHENVAHIPWAGWNLGGRP